MRNKIIIFIAIAINTYGANFDKGVSILEEIVKLLAGSIFQAVMTLVLVGCGYMYVFGKGQESKGILIQVMIGAVLVLGASGLGSLFV